MQRRFALALLSLMTIMGAKPSFSDSDKPDYILDGCLSEGILKREQTIKIERFLPSDIQMKIDIRGIFECAAKRVGPVAFEHLHMDHGLGYSRNGGHSSPGLILTPFIATVERTYGVSLDKIYHAQWGNVPNRNIKFASLPIGEMLELVYDATIDAWIEQNATQNSIGL